MDDDTRATARAAVADTNGNGRALSENAQVSRAMVAVYKSQFGRGPVKAHAEWAGDDVLVCVLEDSLTPAEINLRKVGEFARLRDLRTLFQSCSAEAFVKPVEEITGRQVRSFLSGIDVAEDVSTETFVFHPRNGAQEGRS